MQLTGQEIQTFATHESQSPCARLKSRFSKNRKSTQWRSRKHLCRKFLSTAADIILYKWWMLAKFPTAPEFYQLPRRKVSCMLECSILRSLPSRKLETKESCRFRMHTVGTPMHHDGELVLLSLSAIRAEGHVGLGDKIRQYPPRRRSQTIVGPTCAAKRQKPTCESHQRHRGASPTNSKYDRCQSPPRIKATSSLGFLLSPCLVSQDFHLKPSTHLFSSLQMFAICGRE